MSPPTPNRIKEGRILASGAGFCGYSVVSLLGRGGMGEVYLVKNGQGATYAAKVMLSPEGEKEGEWRKRFMREAKFSMAIRHPNIVKVHDIGEDPDTGICYIVMDYAGGGSLADRLQKNGAMKIPEAVAIASQIVSALDVAHKAGVVHRDIKPDNILFAADGRAMLSDLGIAKFSSAGAENTTVTKTGMIIGTPAYMAPEQMMDSHNVDGRADIYSLGLVLYEMLTGARPHADSTIVELLAKAVNGEELPDIRTVRPEASAALAYVIATMVAPKPEGRPASAEVVAKLFDDLAADRVKVPKEYRHTRAVALRRQKAVRLSIKLFSMAFGIVALLALAVVATVWWQTRTAANRVEFHGIADFSSEEMDNAIAKFLLSLNSTLERIDPAQRQNMRIVLGDIDIDESARRPGIDEFSRSFMSKFRAELLAIGINLVEEPGRRNAGLRHADSRPHGWPTLYLTGGILIRYEYDIPNNRQKECFRLSMTLKDPSSGSIVWSHVYETAFMMDGYDRKGETGGSAGSSAPRNVSDGVREERSADSQTPHSDGAEDDGGEDDGGAEDDSSSPVDEIDDGQSPVIAPAASGAPVLSSRIGDATWYYTLENGGAVLWCARDGNNAMPCVFPKPRGRVVIPESLDGHEVVALGPLAFFNCSDMDEVELPKTLEKIGERAFMNCRQLRSVSLPPKVSSVGALAFANCISLKSVDLANCANLARGNGVFMRCPELERFSVSPGNPKYKTIYGVLHSRDGKTLVGVPPKAFPSISSEIAEIGPMAFMGYAHKICFVPATVRTIHEGAFLDCPNLKILHFAGDAPAVAEGDVPLFDRTPGDMRIEVAKDSKGWNGPGSADLPESWPLGGGSHARKIVYEPVGGDSEGE